MSPRKTDIHLTSWILWLCLMVPAASCFAEYADREQPINLEADQVTVDEANRISTFIGGVRFTQGSLLILGEKIVIEQDKDGFVIAIAHGSPASFRQKRELAEGYIEGYGERINYDTKADMLYLDGQARLNRDKDEVTGEHISYNAKTELFKVNASEGDVDTIQQRRVRVVLQPKEKQNRDTSPPSNQTSDKAMPVESK